VPLTFLEGRPRAVPEDVADSEDLLAELIKARFHRARRVTPLAAAFLVFDAEHQHKLSLKVTRDGRKGWAQENAECVRRLITYVKRLVRRSASNRSLCPAVRRLKQLMIALDGEQTDGSESSSSLPGYAGESDNSVELVVPSKRPRPCGRAGGPSAAAAAEAPVPGTPPPTRHDAALVAAEAEPLPKAARPASRTRCLTRVDSVVSVASSHCAAAFPKATQPKRFAAPAMPALASACLQALLDAPPTVPGKAAVLKKPAVESVSRKRPAAATELPGAAGAEQMPAAPESAGAGGASCFEAFEDTLKSLPRECTPPPDRVHGKYSYTLSAGEGGASITILLRANAFYVKPVEGDVSELGHAGLTKDKFCGVFLRWSRFGSHAEAWDAAKQLARWQR
jgi:hypothetical protein